jgi:hypothetical protein
VVVSNKPGHVFTGLDTDRNAQSASCTTNLRTAEDFAVVLPVPPKSRSLAKMDLYLSAQWAACLGTAVQVEPMKPVLKAPGCMLLNLGYDGPLSDFACNFNLRRCTWGAAPLPRRRRSRGP